MEHKYKTFLTEMEKSSLTEDSAMKDKLFEDLLKKIKMAAGLNKDNKVRQLSKLLGEIESETRKIKERLDKTFFI